MRGTKRIKDELARMTFHVDLTTTNRYVQEKVELVKTQLHLQASGCLALK
jgi:hypothetical protein